MAIATAQAVQLLNLAYFGRPGDPASLPAWGAAGITESKIAEIFVATSEFSTSTNGVTSTGGVRSYNTSTYINTLYNRVVGRDAASSEVTAWSDAISAGLVTHDNLGHVLVTAILNLDESVEMRKVMMAKLDTANLYSDYLDANPSDLSAYSTQAGIDAGRSFMSTVTTSTAKTYAEVAAEADLLDNPTKYTITSANVSAGEGDDLTFTVSLDSAPSEAVTVNYVTGNGSTDSSDFTAASGSITFAAGQTSQIVTVKTTEDTSFEEDETFTITFSGSRLNASVQAVGTITNDDSNPDSVVQSFTLTTGTDSFVGKSGDDTFDAKDGTLTTFDTLNGGSGTDTLTATTSGDNVVLNSTAIEQINIVNSGDTVINMESTTGASGLKIANSTGTITFDNIQSAVTTITASNMLAVTGATHNDVTIDFDGAALSSSSDDLAITVDDAIDMNFVLTKDSSTTNTLETVSLNSISEANTVEHLSSTGVGATKLEVTGDQSLTIVAGLDSEIVTVDGSEATGAISLTATGGNTAVSITTGSGADNVTSGTANDTFVTGAGNDTIDAAAGNDTITSGDGADSITAAAGVDSIVAGAGADIVDAGAGNDIVDAGAGADVITAGAGNDSVDGGADNDTFKFGATELDTDDTLKGAAGTDTIEYTADETVIDADFTNVTNTEVITASADIDIDLTLSTLAAAAGVNAVNLTGDATGDTDTLTLQAGFTNDITVDLDAQLANSVNSIVATNYTGSLTVTAADSDLNDAATGGALLTITGGTGSDKIQVTAGGGTVAGAELASITKVETFEILANAELSTNISFANENATSTETLTVDASAMAVGVTLDATLEADAKVSITGGSGNDSLTGSASAHASGDTILGGAGNDTIFFGNTDLTAVDSVDGGAGSNTLSFNENLAHAVVDEDFTLVSNVQTLTTKAGEYLSATIGTEAAAAGITTVTFADTGDHDTLTVAAGFTNTLTINLDDDADANNIDATAYTGTLTIAGADTSVEGNELITIVGGTGSDTLQLTADADTDLIEDSDIANVSKIETIQFLESAGTTATADIELHNANATYTSATVYDTITVDATALSGRSLINAVAEVDAKVVINTGAGADIITGSASANFGDSITSGAGNDTLKFAYDGLTSADTVTAGSGTDTLEVTSAGSVADAAFTNVTGIETVKATTGTALTLTIGTEAAEAGVTSITFDDENGDDSLTVAAGFTTNLSVALDDDTDANDTNAIDATNYTKSLTITGEDKFISNQLALTTITGGTGSDTLQLTADADTDAIEAADLASITKIETFQFLEKATTTATVDLTIHDANAGYTHASSYDALTIDTSAVAGVSTVDLSAETDSKITLTTGAAADIITLTNSVNFGDSVSSGAGNDTITVATGHLTSIDTIDGGAGTDVLKNSNALTAIDSAFTNVTNIETITAVADKQLTLTLGAEAAEAGITQINLLDDANGVDFITLEAGFTNDITIDFDDDNTVDNKVVATSYTGVLTVTAADTDLTSGNDATITGGTGSDILEITTAGNALTAAMLEFVTKMDTFKVATNAAASITISDNNVVGTASSTDTLTIDASAQTSAASTIDASAEDDGKVVIITGAGADTITGSASANYGDSITAAAGADTISAGVGADTILGGAGADSITGGAGADSITGGADADTFVYTAVSQSNSSASDTITDFTSGTDKFQVTLDYSSIASAVTVDATVQTAGAGVTAAQANLSGNRGQVIYDSTNSKQYINFNNDNLLTSLDYQFGTTAAIAEGDVDFTITTSGSYADTITSGGGADTITAGDGADSITAGAGNDVIIYRAASNHGDVITDWTSGTNTIYFTADDATDDSDVYDAGEVVFAETDPTATAGTIVTLSADDYVEGASGDDFFAADHVNVWTTAAGAANLGAALKAISDGSSTVTDHSDAFLVWYDSTNSVVTLSYITDAGDVAESFGDVVGSTVATFSDVAASGIAAAFANTNFAVESLG